ncbi:hypothetical protein DMUE_0048 [Dictyocoela muelleri]|nr:hypothetical protein DMUE_0048 [Dictyocoela muelleri]
MPESLKRKTNLTYITSCNINERLFMDIIDLRKYHDLNRVYKYILTCLNSFSKFTYCFPLFSKDSIGVSDKLDELYPAEGKWEIIYIYNGKEFCNKVFGYIITKYKKGMYKID